MLQNFVVVAASLTGGEIGLTVPDVISISDTTNYEIALWFMAVSGAVLFSRCLALTGRPHPAGQRPGRGAGRRAGLQRDQAQACRFHHQRLLFGTGRALLVFYLGTASVGTLVDITVGVQIIIAAVLGGRRTILGGVLGAIFLIAMSEVLRPLGDLSNFVVFAMALIVVLLFPGGFFGLLTRTKESGRAPRRAPISRSTASPSALAALSPSETWPSPCAPARSSG